MALSPRGISGSAICLAMTRPSPRVSSTKPSEVSHSVTPDWDSPAGKLLDRLASALPEEPPRTVIVFGSAPLQMLLDRNFLSQDCDVIGDEAVESAARGLSQPTSGGGDLYVQVSDALTFRTAQGWEQRALRIVRYGHTFVFPHPWDILVSKLGRLEEKDLEAFRLVIERTGHPTEEEFKTHLRLAVDLFRPQFDEEHGHDYAVQTRLLWKLVYGAEIDPRTEIIQPALERRHRQYQEGESSLKDRLRAL